MSYISLGSKLHLGFCELSITWLLGLSLFFFIWHCSVYPFCFFGFGWSAMSMDIFTI